MGEIEDSAGSAAAEMSVVEETIEYKLNAFKTTWTGVLQKLVDKGVLGQFIDNLTKISEALGDIISNKAALTIIGSLFAGGYMTNKNVGISMLRNAEGGIGGVNLFGLGALGNQQTLAHNGFFSKTDVAAVNNYRLALQQNTKEAKAWATTMANASTECQNFVRSGYKQGQTIDQISASMKSAAIGTNIFRGALNMLLSSLAVMVISLSISAIVKGVDNLIHQSEKLEEKAKSARDAISELKQGLQDTAQKTDDIKKRYAELAQDVGNLGTSMQNQGRLSTEDYQEFLDLSNQLHDLFPQLTKGYTDNGDAILKLSGNVNTIVGSLDNLIERQRILARQEISKNMGDIWDATFKDGLFDGFSNTDEWLETTNNMTALKDQSQKGGLYGYVETLEYIQDLQSRMDENGFVWLNKENWEENDQILSRFSKRLVDLGLDIDDISTDMENYTVIDMNKLDVNNWIDQYEAKIESAQSRIEQINTEFRMNLQTFFAGDVDFMKMNETQQQLVVEMISTVDMSNLPDDIGNWEQLTAWYKNNIMRAIGEIDNKEIQKEFVKLIANDGTYTEITGFYQDIYTYLINQQGMTPDNPILIYLKATYDEQLDKRNKVINKISKIGDLSPSERARISQQTDVDEWADKLTEKQIELVLNADTSPASYKLEDLEAWLEELETSDHVVKVEVRGAVDTVDHLAEVESAISSLSDLYWQTVKKDPSASAEDLKGWGFADPAKINAVEQAFTKLAENEDEVTKEKLSAALKEFEDTLVKFPGDAAKAQYAMNTLINSYINESSLLKDLTEENKEYVIARLKAMDIENAEAVVQSRLQGSVKKTIEQINILREAWSDYKEALENGDDIEESVEKIKEYIKTSLQEYDNEGNAVGRAFDISSSFIQRHKDKVQRMVDGDVEAFNELREAALKESIELRLSLPTDAAEHLAADAAAKAMEAELSIQDIEIGATINDNEYLDSLATMLESAGMTADEIMQIFEQMGVEAEEVGRTSFTIDGGGGMTSEAAAAMDKYNAQFSIPKWKFKRIGSASTGTKGNLAPTPKSSGGGGGGGDKADEATNDAFDNLKWLYDNDLIDTKTYLDQKRALIQDMWKKGELDAKEYFEKMHEWLREMLDLYNQVISDVQKILQKQIDKLEEERDAKIEHLEEEKKAALDAIDAEAKEIDKLIKKKQEEIDALEKENEKRKAAIDLQKSLYELERAQHQRTLLQYQEGADGKGQMVYRADPNAIKNAQEQVEEQKYQQRLRILNEELEVLNKQKEALDEKRTQTEEYYDKLIEDTNKFYDDAIKKIEDYKKKWEELAEAEENALIESRLASLGLSMESILSLDMGTFETFKGSYLGLLNDIYGDQHGASPALVDAWGDLSSYLASTQGAIDAINTLKLDDLSEAVQGLGTGILSIQDCDGETFAPAIGGAGELTGAFEEAAKAAQKVSNAINGSGGAATAATPAGGDLNVPTATEGQGGEGGATGGNISSALTAVTEDAHTAVEKIGEEFDSLSEKLIGDENSLKYALETVCDGEYRIEINIDVNDPYNILKGGNGLSTGGNSAGGGGGNWITSHSLGLAKFDGTVGAAFFNGYPGLGSPESDAIRSEFGQPELTVYPNGTYEITTSPIISDLPKGTVIFNEEQTRRILKNSGKGGRAFATGTASYSPISSLMPEKAAMYSSFESRLGEHLDEMRFNMSDIANNVREITTAVTTNQFNAGGITNHNTINVTCPGVTETEVAKHLGSAIKDQLDGMATGMSLRAYQRSVRR